MTYEARFSYTHRFNGLYSQKGWSLFASSVLRHDTCQRRLGRVRPKTEIAELGDDYLQEALRAEPLLKAYLFRFAPNAADVDELLQETYARLLTSTAAKRVEIRSVRALALTIARNVALDWIRHRDVVDIKLVSDLAALDVLDESAQVEDIVNARQELALLAECVAELPERCRQAFTLRRVYGFTQQEIARRLRIEESTVEQLLARAVRRCAEILAARGSTADRADSLAQRLARRLRHHE